MRGFPKNVKDKLEHYVYRLVDPRDCRTFYIGMGQNNRIFKQTVGREIARGVAGGRMEARQILRDIEDAGLEPLRIVHRSGMTKDQAIHVEEALIFAYPGVTNHRPKKNTPMDAQQLARQSATDGSA